MSVLKITQQRQIGDWYVWLEGERLPVGHSIYLNHLNQYFDPGRGGVSPRWQRWINDVQNAKRMVIQITQWGPEYDQEGYPIFHCVDYLGAFTVSNPRLTKDKFFRCDEVTQYADVVRYSGE
jgi:hypothetical protein